MRATSERARRVALLRRLALTHVRRWVSSGTAGVVGQAFGRWATLWRVGLAAGEAHRAVERAHAKRWEAVRARAVVRASVGVLARRQRGVVALALVRWRSLADKAKARQWSLRRCGGGASRRVLLVW
jgi:hypothetical protein